MELQVTGNNTQNTCYTKRQNRDFGGIDNSWKDLLYRYKTQTDKRVNKIPLSGNIYLDENGNLKLRSDKQNSASKTLLYITELENETPTRAHRLC